MGEKLAVWAMQNPLAAIALASSLAGGCAAVIVASGRAARPIAEAIRAYRNRNGHGEEASRETSGHAPRIDSDPLLRYVSKSELDEVVATQHRLFADLEERVIGKQGVTERIAIVEATVGRIEGKVDALPETVGEKFNGLMKKWLSEADDKIAASRRDVACVFSAVDSRLRAAGLTERRDPAHQTQVAVDRRSKDKT